MDEMLRDMKISKAALARYLGVSESTVWSWVKHGAPRHVDIYIRRLHIDWLAWRAVKNA